MNLGDLLKRFTLRRDERGALVERPDGSRMYLDVETARYLESRGPIPTQERLDAVLAHARRARVTQLVPRNERLEDELLLDIDEPETVASLCATLRIVDGPYGHCMCFGNPHVTFLDDTGAPIAKVSVHHGLSIRWEEWGEDAQLADGTELLNWLSNHGVRQPLEEFRAEHAAQAAREKRWNEWRAATPPPLRPLLEPYAQSVGQVVFSPSPAHTKTTPMPPLVPPHHMPEDHYAHVVDTCEAAYPNETERARVLFEWLGSGGREWSGGPVYEYVPEYLLLRVPLPGLLQACETDRSDAVTLGAARFFTSHCFHMYRSDDVTHVPGGLRQRLREAAEMSGIPDNVQRMREAFPSG
jgi:hypothetical protein